MRAGKRSGSDRGLGRGAEVRHGAGGGAGAPGAGEAERRVVAGAAGIGAAGADGAIAGGARFARDPGKLRDVDELLTRRWARRGLPGLVASGKAMTPGGNREGYRKYEQEKAKLPRSLQVGGDIAVDPLTWLGPGGEGCGHACLAGGGGGQPRGACGERVARAAGEHGCGPGGRRDGGAQSERRTTCRTR